MYPILRLAKELYVHRNDPPLEIFDTHVSHHICWPNDIDIWMELNNGRTLTLFDLGRVVMFKRLGINDLIIRKKWAGTVAGSSIRYRRRVTTFMKLEMRSRVIGWDERFIYLEQGMYHKGECTSHVLMRTAVTDRTRIIPTAEVAAALGASPESPPLPGWVQNFADAAGERPWPPHL
ncbi:acyl-CoA thioesterase [Palleronia caenipelagi]|uniref:Acyl-CoA thioesterase n=1 Tax=Palleronia caenipelagi TaxID=2489174 RepID=A0A547Q2N6_9RHOB|nr:acyl-CoA thioesterase [Palleronia caenipelagi]TRD20643.1 acyl-CoA thioesterase [Palleronia caenipelagi]